MAIITRRVSLEPTAAKFLLGWEGDYTEKE
jgi:hypothetical protein